MSRNYLTATFLLILPTACFTPELHEQVTCGEHGECPPGLRCEASANVCVPDDQAAIAALRFMTPPSSAEALVAAPTVIVELLDTAGHRVLFTGGSFTLDVEPNARGVGLVTPVTGIADAGLVTFAAPEFDRPGRSVRLLAKLGSIVATSAPFDVSPTRPVVVLASPGDEVSSCASVSYQLTQAQGLPVDLLVEVDPDGPSGPEPFRRATQAASAPGLAGVQGVPGSPDGASRVFSWNTSVDLPFRSVTGQLRITPSVNGVAGSSSVRDVTVKNALQFEHYSGPGVALPMHVTDTNHDHRPEVIEVDPEGDFSLPSAFIDLPPNMSAKAVTSGDFDGNGLIDVAVALETKPMVALQLRSSPRGDFAAPFELHDVAPLREVVAADFDHDGVSELAGVDATSGAVVILRGDRAAAGQLVERARPWDQGGAGRLHVADLDRDGWADLVVGRSSPTAPVVFLRGTPAGFMAPSTDSGLVGDVLAVGDLDHDGRDDVAALEADGLHVVSATGRSHVPGITGQAIGLGDLDGDGRTDIVTVSSDQVQFHRHVAGRGTIAFDPPWFVGVSQAVSWLVVKDMNLDGRVDINTFSYVNEVKRHSYLNDTPRRCGARLSGPIDVHQVGLRLSPQTADLNADGKPDFLGLGDSGNSDTYAVTVTYGLGDGTFDLAPVVVAEFPDEQSVSRVEPADYDGDGATDLAFVAFRADAVTLLFNDPRQPGRFDRFELRSDDFVPDRLASGDLDGDGAPDLVIAGSGQIQVRRGDPAGERTWAEPVALATGLDVGEVGCWNCKLLVDDLDRDGHLDILLWTESQLLTFLAEPGSASGFAEPIITPHPGGALLTPASLLPDGRRMLVVVHPNPHRLAAYALDATRTAVEKAWEVALDSDIFGSSGAADFDGNGLDEVLVAYHGLARLSATPELSLQPLSHLGLYSDFTLADVDGDGQVEIINNSYSIDMAADGQPDLGQQLSPRGVSPDGSSAERMALGDFSGDGLLDLASVDSSARRVWLARQASDEPGQLEGDELSLPGDRYVGLGDLDGDATADLVTPGSGGSLAFLGLDGTAPAPLCTSESSQGPVAVGDVTDDGLADVVTSDTRAVLLFENPAFSCSPPVTVMSLERPGATTHLAKAIVLGDMNIDGLLDVVVISDAVRIALQVPGAPGTFQVADFEYEDVPPYPTYFDGLVADVDQDGQPDVIAIDKNEEIRVFIGNPFFPGKLMPSTLVPGSGRLFANQGTSLALGDVQGDYWPDIVTTGGDKIQVFLDAGFGNYAYAYSLPGTYTNPDGGRLSVVDFDADGRGDVVYVDPEKGTMLLRGR